MMTTFEMGGEIIMQIIHSDDKVWNQIVSLPGNITTIRTFQRGQTIKMNQMERQIEKKILMWTKWVFRKFLERLMLQKCYKNVGSLLNYFKIPRPQLKLAKSCTLPPPKKVHMNVLNEFDSPQFINNKMFLKKIFHKFVARIFTLLLVPFTSKLVN